MRHRWKRERQDEEVEGEVGRERQMAQGVEASWVGDSPKGGSAYTTNSTRGLPPRPQQVTPPSSTLTPIPLSSSGHKQQAGLHAGVTSVSQAGASQAGAALASQAGVYHVQKAVVTAVFVKVSPGGRVPPFPPLFLRPPPSS